MDLYHCSHCHYKTHNKQRYAIHLQSNKHYNAIHNCSIYECTMCNKKYKYKSGLEKHIVNFHHDTYTYTYTHTVGVGNSVKDAPIPIHTPSENENEDFFTCKCGNTYKHKSSISRHKKECKQKSNENTLMLNQQVQELHNSFDLNKLIHVFETLLEKVNSSASTTCTTHTTTNTITNSNNKTINIITFLNDDCKEAPNFVDFLKDLVVSRDDLYYVEQHGFVKSFEKVIMSRLENMSINKRPIHCTDPKRKAFVYKNEDMWVREIIKAYPYIKLWLSKLLGMELENWKRENPGWLEDDDKCDFVNKANVALSYPYINETRDDQVYKSLLFHLAKLKLDKHCIHHFFEEEGDNKKNALENAFENDDNVDKNNNYNKNNILITQTQTQT